MRYQVVFDSLVYKADFKRIDNVGQKTILKAIRKKLTTNPDKYGEALTYELKGPWKLRVGDYRVIYEIRNEQVMAYVIMVGYRRDEEVYKEAARRLRLI